MAMTEKTKRKYRRTAKQIRSRYFNETGIQPEDDCARFQAWLVRIYRTIAPRSRRLYRNALHHFQGAHHPECMPDPIPKGLPKVAEIRKQYGRRGSAMKAKSMNAETEQAIDSELARLALDVKFKIALSGSDDDSGDTIPPSILWAQALMRAGVVFGLRPGEWFRARFVAPDDDPTEMDGEFELFMEGRRLYLHVVNGKAGNGRAFGSMRTLMIDLKYVDENALEAASWLIEQAQKVTEKQFDRIIENTRAVLYHAIERCGRPCRPRGSGRVTLYTARHQFAANAKHAGMSELEIAALMGHASTETATQHYGRKRHGRSRDGVTPVKPHPGDVQRVMRIQQEKNRIREQKARRPASRFRMKP